MQLTSDMHSATHLLDDILADAKAKTNTSYVGIRIQLAEVDE